jgi:hypothetical protein
MPEALPAGRASGKGYVNVRLIVRAVGVVVFEWEGCALPNPPTSGGMGKPGFPIPLRTGCALTFPGAGAGAWGNPVSPHPSPRA